MKRRLVAYALCLLATLGNAGAVELTIPEEAIETVEVEVGAPPGADVVVLRNGESIWTQSDVGEGIALRDRPGPGVHEYSAHVRSRVPRAAAEGPRMAISDWVEATTRVLPATPPTPEGFRVDERSDDRAVVLDWQPDAGIDRYRLFRDGKRIAEVDAPPYRDTDAQPGRAHAYRIATLRADEQSSKSHELRGLREEAPSVRGPLRRRGAGEAAYLSWPKAEGTVRHYEVRFSPGTWTGAGERIGTTEATRFDIGEAISGLPPRGYWRVRPVNAAGPGEWIAVRVGGWD